MRDKVFQLFLLVILSSACTILSYAQGHPSFVKSSVAGDSTVATRYSHAVELFNVHDDTGEALEEAKNEFSSILRMNPRHAPSLAYLGLIALENNNTKSADSLFTLALATDSTCPEAHVGRAQMFRQQLKWQEGYEEAHRAVKLAPSSTFARWELVNELLRRVEAPVTDSVVDEAIPHLLKLLELNSDDRQAHLDLAQSYERFKRWRDAVSHYREVLRIGQLPEDMDVWVYEVHQDVVRCFENLELYDEAVKELKLYITNLKELQSDEGTIKAVEQRIHDLEKKTTIKK